MKKTIRILLFAYACEPNRGSEPGVGWHWAIELAKDVSHEVYVLTRTNNESVINRYFANTYIPVNLHFLFYDLPAFVIYLKRVGLPIEIYYKMWLYGAIRYARVMHAIYRFDIAHHVTFGTFRNPAALYKLNIPYIIGPVGGAETTPPQLMCLYSARERFRENIRMFAMHLSMLNPLTRKAYDNAYLVFAKTKETKRMLNQWKNKVIVRLEIGVPNVEKSCKSRDKHSFLYVGNFLYLKGIKLSLLAFAKYAKSYPQAKFVMIGKGEMEKEIRDFKEKHKLNIELLPWMPQERLHLYYESYRVLLFPSMHDSSGNVVLEAMAHGMPVVAINTGGPVSVMGDEIAKELTVPTTNQSVEDVVDKLVAIMVRMSNDEDFYQVVQKKVIGRAETLLWARTINETYALIKKSLFST